MKAALFDMDGLMYDTERVVTEIWLKLGKEMSIEFSLSFIASFRGTNREYKEKLFKKTFGEDFDVDALYERREKLLDEYYKNNPIPVKKGLIELMSALKEKEYLIAIATSTSRNKAQEYWKSTDVLKYIDASVCGDEVTISKPNPEIFLKAAEKLGVDIKECFVLEDSPNGLQAGFTAGATTIMIPDMTPPNEKIRGFCNYIFSDLGQVIEII